VAAVVAAMEAAAEAKTTNTNTANNDNNHYDHDHVHDHNHNHNHNHNHDHDQPLSLATLHHSALCLLPLFWSQISLPPTPGCLVDLNAIEVPTKGHPPHQLEKGPSILPCPRYFASHMECFPVTTQN